MERNENYDELLRRKISETLGEPIDGSMNADDLMFDLGMRYLRLVTAEKKNMERIRANQLSLWADGAASKEALVRYVESVTDENSPDYIPPVDRIAVFDLDGTLFCETDPVWFDFMMYKYRVTEDEAYRDRATEYDRTLADAVQSIIDTGDISVTNYVTGNGRYRAAAFFLCCDDGVRENGSEEKARKIRDLCAENGWIPISMKNDWLTVFGEDVTKKDHFTQGGGIIGE